MRSRLIISALVSAIGVVAALSIPARAQAPSKAVSTGAPAKPFATPKTPWGDPDISGTWSSDDLRNVPVQRPAELGNQAQLSDDEYAKRLAANDEARTRELNRVGAFRNDVGTRTFRQTSLVVEPADGRLPITAEAQRRSIGDNSSAATPRIRGPIAACTIAASRAACSDRCCR